MATIDTPNNTNFGAAMPSFPGSALAVTPSDVDEFASAVTIYVGGAGNVTVRPAFGGAAVTFVGLPAGSVVPCLVIGVDATGTTATSLVAIY